jgi:CRISPR type I-E-associated protein CasB/Cse2
MQFTNPEIEARPAPRSHSSIIGSIGSLLGAEWFSNADRAQLKRYRPQLGVPEEIAALRVLVAAGCPVEAMRPAELLNWVFLVHCMALLSGPGRDPHSISSDSRPGRLLVKAGYNEFRLCRLLESRGERLRALLERAARRISKLGEPLNWTKLAPLIFLDDPEGLAAERARIEIARDFAAAAARNDFRNAGSPAETA